MLANRTEFIDAIAAKHGEGFVFFAREALRKGDLLACDRELVRIGYPP
jgi:hypothetical protein